VSGLFVPNKKEIRAAQGHAAQSGLRHVVVRWDGRVAQEAAEFAKVPKQVADG
jgi:hypothetical protein